MADAPSLGFNRLLVDPPVSRFLIQLELLRLILQEQL
jgi:hypothetical protein